ncbi:Spc98 family-domain-containing protein [Lipomyces tetrasporus]|uniref:Spc98 family-domain-containing protein n=1 Tax=Lipomyces tetrasporus TaxID=54092 RepID=A0AAD7QKT9_9ASCO|nr:Spc98 family-domain-containing protein [Lipomyces tetrasporus]KAJ8097114.1 Spc98 family-domain-containing protein [Lipomyces tetrasporus]
MSEAERDPGGSPSPWIPDSAVQSLTTSVSAVVLQTKADVLALNKPPTDPSETKLLSDIPFTLQGLNTSTLPFVNSNTISLPNTLPLPTISILHSLVEPALLYKHLMIFIESPSGLIGQAFRRAIEKELRGYLSLVSKIDEEIRKELETEKTAQEWKRGWSLGGVTLRKCIYWLREPTIILRLMTDMADKCKDKNGGRLLNVLYSYTYHGDPFISDFASRLLKDVSRPFYDFLQQWIYTGDVRDPYLEFFVQRGDQKDAFWDGKYVIEESQVPTFISDELVQKIFQTGKSLDFIRMGCGGGDWVDRHGTELSRAFHYGDPDGEIEVAIDTAYRKTVTHLMFLLTTKFKLKEHIQALKNYLLLGQGDFVAILMELLAPSLERPANTLYRHNLTSTLETAIRGSNAQYSIPEVLRNLDARMLELSHGEIGWDVFTLEYKVEPPLDVVVNAYATRQYLKIFNFLWRLKRVGFVLDVAWRRSITGARGILSYVKDAVDLDWKMARACCSEMIHFICQLEYYILYEVIESSWSELQKELNKTDLTLDHLIEVHTRYLGNITHKGLLGSARAGKEDSLIHQLHEILKTMLSFTDAIDALYNFSLEEYTRRPTAGSSSLGDNDKSAAMDTDLHSSISTRIKSLKANFHFLVEKLLGDLAYQSDTEMRFLGVRLNFNEYYAVPRHRKTTSDAVRAQQSA